MTQKLVWITGGQTGIGAALAKLYCAKGWAVYTSSRSDPDLPLDITDAAACAQMVSQIEARFGKIDLAILNAGTYEPTSTLDADLESYKMLMDVNYFGTLNCVKALLPFMQKQGGEIAIVASLAGYRGLPNGNGYGPSKAALINYTESLKAELADSPVSIRLINPGFVETPLTDKNTFEMPDLITPDQAASEIYEGLNKKQFEVRFPKSFARKLAVLKLLPYGCYFAMLKKLGIG